jgi:uncharacterized protein YyaL (SSP411 family)
MYNLFYLGRLLEKEEWKQQSLNSVAITIDSIKKFPASLSQWGINLLFQWAKSEEWVITGQDTSQLLGKALEIFRPLRILAASNVENSLPLLKSKEFKKEALLYVCENFYCKMPVNDVKALPE